MSAAEPVVEPGPASGPQPGPQVKMECAKLPPLAFLHSPPDSNEAAKSDASDSELSDLEDEPVLDGPPPVPPEPAIKRETLEPPTDTAPPVDDLGEVLPDSWSGAVPVFRPTARQFSDFQWFVCRRDPFTPSASHADVHCSSIQMKQVDSYGMKSGIIKIIPPTEWKDAQPPLDDLVKYIKVREPIKQDIMGSNGTYRQVNILHGRSYNLPQWRQLCEQSEHQPPARRGERRANADKPKPPPRSRPSLGSKTAKPSTPKKRGKAKSIKTRGKQAQNEEEDRPITPVSPKEDSQDEPVDSIEKDAADDGDDADAQDCRPAVGRMGAIRQPKAKTQSVSARRKYSRREGSAMIDEAAFKDFDYRIDGTDYTPERCEELERAYWKTLTYAAPLYGADMMGTLFDDRTPTWNLNKLPNLLDVLGTKVPGVNTAYLYLGMWKATFAWHLEDVDLYSINYLHFGAPKQWYSISQADARRFEAAMKNVWPADAKACDQFLRHKSFLISPHHLLQHYGIKVNKVVSYPGEFVVTYPYGYHSGYNLGYNCAEAVNFALESWLDMGKIAKRCECAQAQDSVWVNVYEIERKLRGEETEYEETEDDGDDGDGDDADTAGLPTPPAGLGVRFKDAGRKRKRALSGVKRPKIKVKRIKLRLKAKVEPPCCLCPHDVPGLAMIPTDDGRKAHRMCALYVPETYIDDVDGKEIVCNVSGIHKDRLDLKCLFCRSKRGASFQCSKKKCARAYHATCAAAAGVFVEEQDVPVFGEDGTEFKEQAFEFSCRFHRTRRDKKKDGDALEADEEIRTAAAALVCGEIRQFQYGKGEIFAGMVVENRPEEQMVLLDVMPIGDRIEVEWKWLLLPDPSDFHLPKASAKAVPLPSSRKAKDELNAKRFIDRPRKDDVFGDGFTWAEFQLQPVANAEQAKVDFAKPDQIWHYLGKKSTDARAQYTEDPNKCQHNPRANFMDTIPKPPKPLPPPRSNVVQPVGAVAPMAYTHAAVARPEKPYVYKPRKPIKPQLAPLMYVPQRPGPLPGAAATNPPHHPPYPAVAPAPQSGEVTARVGSQNGPQHGLPPPGRSAPVHGLQALQARPPAAVAPMPVPIPARVSVPGIQRPLQGTQPKPGPAPQARPSWQVHSSVYPRYPFFQVNHNRDASKYRSPYAPWGGFTNGYEYLMPRQSDLLRRPVPRPQVPAGPDTGYPLPQNVARLGVPANMVPAPAAPQASAPVMAPPMGMDGGILPPPMSGVPGRPLHPAIKPQYGLTLPQTGQQQQQPQQQPPPPQYQHQHQHHHQHQHPLQHQQPRPAVTPTPKSYKVGLPAAINLALKSTKPAVQTPPRESPVPLPANFLAAMASSPGSQQASSSPQPVSQSQSPGLQALSTQASSLQAPSMQPHKPVMLPPPAFCQQRVATPESQTDRGVQLAHSGPTAGPRIEVDGNQSSRTSEMPRNIPDSSAQATSQAGASTSIEAAVQNVTPGTGVSDPRVGLQQEFPDVPGSESMRFVERMMENLKRVSQRADVDNGH
ncbi:hypothetical protein CDD80_5744 [Ophiocordyceps camponoti-rufipedis]|uniref:[histone H3]-trimethyl-L-lysine(9) demethylase n=1 Tax=Ophiocordyceps camponoti-rufipedis TaxID=2004952 RepID=A0A2C5ZGW5_9HYPO|nr:hypothetical protein CDD80_5744 [Ophiocordyceps camponoti-rufipedis]